MVMDSRIRNIFGSHANHSQSSTLAITRSPIGKSDLTRLGKCPNCRIGWRWLVWHRFSHKNRTQLPSRMRLHDSKRRVRASGIFDSHRPLHFSLSGVSLRCPGTQLCASPGSHTQSRRGCSSFDRMRRSVSWSSSFSMASSVRHRTLYPAGGERQ